MTRFSQSRTPSHISVLPKFLREHQTPFILLLSPSPPLPFPLFPSSSLPLSLPLSKRPYLPSTYLRYACLTIFFLNVPLFLFFFQNLSTEGKSPHIPSFNRMAN